MSASSPDHVEGGMFQTMPRFQGAEHWAQLTPEQQAEIGAIALEYAAGFLAIDILAARGLDDIRARVVEAAWNKAGEDLIEACTHALPEAAWRGEDGQVAIPAWPEVAIYLRDICTRAVKAETKVFKEGAFYRRRRTLRTKRQASADFVDALVIRLAARVIELFKATINGRAILDAQAAAKARFPESTIFERPERQSRFHEARSAGWSAGGRVPLSHGVGKAAPLQISLFEGVE